MHVSSQPLFSLFFGQPPPATADLAAPSRGFSISLVPPPLPSHTPPSLSLILFFPLSSLSALMLTNQCWPVCAAVVIQPIMDLAAPPIAHLPSVVTWWVPRTIGENNPPYPVLLAHPGKHLVCHVPVLKAFLSTAALLSATFLFLSLSLLYFPATSLSPSFLLPPDFVLLQPSATLFVQLNNADADGDVDDGRPLGEPF